MEYTVSDVKKKRVIAEIQKDARRMAACQRAGTTHQTLRRWMKDDSQFLADFLEAELEGLDQLADDLIATADNGDRKWILARRLPQEWGRQREMTEIEKEVASRPLLEEFMNGTPEEKRDDEEDTTLL